MWEGLPSPPREVAGTSLASSAEKCVFYLKWRSLVKLTEMDDNM